MSLNRYHWGEDMNTKKIEPRMMLSKAQVGRFWGLFGQAWKHVARERRIDPGDRVAQEAYRKELLQRATAGCDSLKLVGRGAPYDRLMVAVAQDAQDVETAIYMATATERRMRDMASDCLRQIAEIDGRHDLPTDAERWEYLGYVMHHAFGHWDWQDIPAECIEKVFMMMDSHRRRLLDRAGWRGVRKDARPLAYAFGRRYRRSGNSVLLANARPHGGREKGTA